MAGTSELRSDFRFGTAKTYRTTVARRSHTLLLSLPSGISSLSGCARRLLTRNNIDEEVELIGLAQRLSYIRSRERPPLIRVGNDECPRSNLRNKDCV